MSSAAETYAQESMPLPDWKFFRSQISCRLKMSRITKIAALCLLVGYLSGCISSPTSEVMVDTNAKTKKRLPGEPENVLPPPQYPIGLPEGPIGPH